MMIIQDPSTVFVGTVEHFAQTDGDVVKKFCDRYGAIGGVNGGEFVDMGSYSYTACPVGGVISQGQPVYENNNIGKWNLVCLTNDNKLILLKGYSVSQAMAMGVRDAVHVKHETGPFLIIDGEPLEVPEYITGKTDWVWAGEGDQSVKLINGANVRKETANISAEIAALLPTIKRV
jgi:exopolysaccharide biosynthesis protein